MAMESINDTIDPNELVPSLLVYGVLPTFVGPFKTRTKQSGRCEALKLVKAELESIEAD